MTGHGGWPLNVFLTPEQLPFYGGTYFPPEPRHGMPAWTQVLQAIAESWSERSEEIRAGGERLREQLGGGARADALDAADRRAGARRRRRGAARLLRRAARAASAGRRSSRRPRRSSSCCCAASARWRCRRCARWPPAASTTSSAAASPATASTARGRCRTSRRCSTTTRCSRAPTCTAGRRSASGACSTCASTRSAWALREMRGPEGGFYSALDADSEGVEGRYYVWTLDELRDVLGDDADAAIDWFGATEQGNFSDPHHPEPGLNVLHRPRARTRRGRARRRHARAHPRAPARRARAARAARPGRQAPDAWNALMISALAETGAALRDEPVDGVDPALAQALLDAAVSCAEFVLERAARRARAAAAHLQRRPREDRRLPGGSRVPARGDARAVRSDLRGALVRRRRPRSRTS